MARVFCGRRTLLWVEPRTFGWSHLAMPIARFFCSRGGTNTRPFSPSIFLCAPQLFIIAHPVGRCLMTLILTECPAQMLYLFFAHNLLWCSARGLKGSHTHNPLPYMGSRGKTSQKCCWRRGFEPIFCITYHLTREKERDQIDSAPTSLSFFLPSKKRKIFSRRLRQCAMPWDCPWRLGFWSTFIWSPNTFF